MKQSGLKNNSFVVSYTWICVTKEIGYTYLQLNSELYRLKFVLTENNTLIDTLNCLTLLRSNVGLTVRCKNYCIEQNCLLNLRYRPPHFGYVQSIYRRENIRHNYITSCDV